jgi:UDP-glucose 4-epimerase
MKVLMTGGLGYIGAHTCVQALNKDHDVILVDNLSNSSIDVLESLEVISSTPPSFLKIDICNAEAISQACASIKPDIVIHLAGLKAVAESVSDPLAYYGNNVVGTYNLLSAMLEAGCSRLVFSSSATVYGPPQYLPLDESHPLQAINPYGQTKIDIERMLASLCESNSDFAAMALRYFNPIGAHASALIGDYPRGTPNNLMPFVTRVAKGELSQLKVFGADYQTRDGTGIRDYIHVEDLAAAHVSAMDWTLENRGFEAVNVGTGKGYSVLDVIDRFRRVNDIPVDFAIEERRPGDVAECYAACDKAADLLGFRAQLDLDAMLSSAWAWEQNKS